VSPISVSTMKQPIVTHCSELITMSQSDNLYYPKAQSGPVAIAITCIHKPAILLTLSLSFVSDVSSILPAVTLHC
jgi:hypothetical protein